MKLWHQTEFTDSELGTQGNCFSCCIASILDLDLSIVPNFCQYGENWALPYYNFLNAHGYESEGTFYFNGFSTNANLTRTWKDLLKVSKGRDGVFIVGGPSPRHENVSHAVLYKDDTLFHDPYLDGNGLLFLKYAHLIEKL